MVVSAVAQEPQERTIDEIKAEAIHRAENGMYPLIGVDPADLREAFASVKTRDKDEWAAAFITVGDRYMAEGDSLAATDPMKANADYIRAWRLYSFGRWPIPASPGKQTCLLQSNRGVPGSCPPLGSSVAGDSHSLRRV